MIEKMDSGTDFKHDEFNKFSNYIDELVDFQDTVQVDLSFLETSLSKYKSKESEYQKILETKADESKKRENDSVKLVIELKTHYEKNILKLKNHYEKQIAQIVEKHKYSVKKWKSIYDSLKDPNTPEKVNIENYDKKFYENKIERITKELDLAQSKIVNFEIEENKHKKERVHFEQQVKNLQKQVSTLKENLEQKDDEIDNVQNKLKESEKKNKASDEEIKKLSEKLKKSSSKSESKIVIPKSEPETVVNQTDAIDSDELENCKVKIALLKTDIRSNKKELDRKTVYCDSLREELSKKNEELHSTKTKLAEAEKQIVNHLKTIDSYKNKMSRNEWSMENKESEIMVNTSLLFSYFLKLFIFRN